MLAADFCDLCRFAKYFPWPPDEEVEERDGACETAEGFDEAFELALSEFGADVWMLVSESERWWRAWRTIFFFFFGSSEGGGWSARASTNY